MRPALILFVIVIISSSSIVSMAEDSYEMDIGESEAIKLAYDYFDKEMGILGKYKVTASKHTTPSNPYIDRIENKSVADEYIEILDGKRYWAVCFYTEDIKDKVQEYCPVVVFLDASTGERLTIMVTLFH